MSQCCELAAWEPAANRPRLIGWFPYLNEVNMTHFLFTASCQTQHTGCKKVSPSALVCSSSQIITFYLHVWIDLLDDLPYHFRHQLMVKELKE